MSRGGVTPTHKRARFLANWLAAAACVAAPSFAADLTGKIQTVLGPIAPPSLGITLTHEHLFIDFTLPLDEPQRWALAGRHVPRSELELAVWNMPVTMEKLAFLHAH